MKTLIKLKYYFFVAGFFFFTSNTVFGSFAFDGNVWHQKKEPRKDEEEAPNKSL
jgi:hypothetical protein